MFRLTKKAGYGLMALKYIATYTGDGSLRAREIAEAYNIPPQLLAKSLQRLAKAGIVRSQAGIKGGYSLPRPPQQISARYCPRHRRAAASRLVRERLRDGRAMHDQEASGASQRKHSRSAAPHQCRRPDRIGTKNRNLNAVEDGRRPAI